MRKQVLAGLAVALSFITASPVFGIPFSTAPAGGTVSVPGDYATLKGAADAFNALSGGIQGDWVVEITASVSEPANMCWGNAMNGKSLP